jgi:hypothetical protein
MKVKGGLKNDSDPVRRILFQFDIGGLYSVYYISAQKIQVWLILYKNNTDFTRRPWYIDMIDQYKGDRVLCDVESNAE